VPVALDQPGAVVAVDEAADGLAQLVDGVVQLSPQALFLEVRIRWRWAGRVPEGFEPASAVSQWPSSRTRLCSELRFLPTRRAHSCPLEFPSDQCGADPARTRDPDLPLVPFWHRSRLALIPRRSILRICPALARAA
jgi:hypothetical protein